MIALYLVVAIGLLTLGHIFKSYRWKLFTSVYETIPTYHLITSLSAGYLINFFVPLHGGDLFRIWYAGRRMKNGYGYATATVVVDRCLDVLAVCLIALLFLFHRPTEVLRSNLLTYGIMSGVIVLLCLLGLWRNRDFKQLSLYFCSLFNEGIKFRLLFFLWSLISSFKDLFRKVSFWKLFLGTVLMWGSYLGSYYFLGRFLQQMGYAMGLQECFCLLFGGNALLDSTFLSTTGLFRTGTELLLCLYILLPLPILLLWACFRSRKQGKTDACGSTASLLLPHRKPEEQLHFLHLYFEGNQRQALHTYLNMNGDVVILRDYSSGSDATTMLCLKDHRTVFRKYAFGAAAEKLREQAQWLKDQAGKLPLPAVSGEKFGPESFCYDMPYPKDGTGLFQYMYCHSAKETCGILERVLTDLGQKLHSSQGARISAKDLETYVEGKILGNLRQIRQSKVLRPLTESDHLVINGVSYRNLPLLEELFSREYLKQVFAGDRLSEVHGDLTLENIICYTEWGEEPYYLIDPNPGNPVKSPYIDYAKLLQSLHGKYEFLETCHPTRMTEGSIDFLLPDSPRAVEVYTWYHGWLEEHFSPEAVRSIYFHEMVHWLRLMPYRLRRNEATAPCYYAAMILVMNDIARLFGKDAV
ncbi:MAG: flippase-like domain-containing protein [Oscillospiraceae bacterium]|nr:flippase-like domain-containing protein [Oscillospiraceae bacterium]